MNEAGRQIQIIIITAIPISWILSQELLVSPSPQSSISMVVISSNMSALREMQFCTIREDSIKKHTIDYQRWREIHQHQQHEIRMLLGP